MKRKENVDAYQHKIFLLEHCCPRDAQRDAHLAEVAPQAHSMLSLFLGKRSEIPLPYGNRRIKENALKPIY